MARSKSEARRNAAHTLAEPSNGANHANPPNVRPPAAFTRCGRGPIPKSHTYSKYLLRYCTAVLLVPPPFTIQRRVVFGPGTNTWAEDKTMKNANPAKGSQIKTPSACALCEGTFAHESWCATRDPGASYAYQIIVDASKMTPGDSLILHSLGVVWTERIANAA